MEDLENFIRTEIPQDGEWFADGAGVFIRYAKELYNEGISPSFMEHMFADLYSAVSREYGK